MSETEMLPTRKSYGMFALWGIHTLMLVFFMVAEATGLHFPVGSSVFYFAWIAIWMTHGLSIRLIQAWDHEAAEGDPSAGHRFWRRLVLAAHGSLYVSFGPLVILWWLMNRGHGPLENGEGQGLWIYPVWLMVLLAHGTYVMIRDRQHTATSAAEKPKRNMPRLKRLMEPDAEAINIWDDDDQQKNKR